MIGTQVDAENADLVESNHSTLQVRRITIQQH